MTFLGLSLPIALALLVATAGAVLVLYWLKPPPRRVLVPSTAIWARVLHERRHRSDFWRWLVSLLVALVIGLAIASALGRPEVEALSGEIRRIAVVIDNTPTMATRTGSGATRWELALTKAGELLGQGSEGSQFLVTDTAGQLVATRFTDRRSARDELQSLELAFRRPLGFPQIANPADGIPLETYFITDGVAVSEVPDGVVRISVFEPAVNVGITAFDVQPVPADPTRYQAFVEVSNAWSEPRQVGIRIDGAGRRAVQRSIGLEPGETKGESFDLAEFEMGPLRVLIQVEQDELPLDNVAYGYLPQRNHLACQLVTDGNNSYLETLLTLDPRIDLERVRPDDFDPESVADLFVFDGFAPEAAPRGPSLLVRPPMVDWIPSGDQEVTELALSGAYAEHALLRHVSLDDLIVERAVQIDADETLVVAGSRERPLILAGEEPLRWVELAFGLSESNLPLQSGFPIFLANTIDWLTSVEVLSARVGSIEVPLTDVVITDVDGNDVASRRVGDSVFFRAEAPGLFAVKGAKGKGERRQLVAAANLLEPRVTAVNDSSFVRDGQPGDTAVATGIGGSELWLVLVLLALGLLLAEWWTYHRRLTV